MNSEQHIGAAAEPGYVAVVYFHGMGSQRRYEELSRLIDALDCFANGHSKSSNGQEFVGIRAQLERQNNQPPHDWVGYVELIRKAKQANGGWSRSEFRFYEAYWAHVTAGGVPTREVLTWLLAQVMTPLRALRTPWRLRARLRRAALLEVWPRLEEAHPDAKRGDLKRLLDAYDDFEGWEARRNYPKGNAREFIDFVHGRWKEKDTPLAERMEWLARQWRRRYVRIELRNLFYVTTAALALLLVGLGLVAIAAGLLQLTSGILPVELLTRLGEDSLKPSAANVTVAAGVILAALGGGRFLRDFLGDVQFWTTYEETAAKGQKRRDILDTCAKSLEHVLRDPACQRVVVISHSLGTTVAFDTILELARRNRATGVADSNEGKLRLGKIQHFITLASPIDKVHYFFESHAGKYHRYNRVVEEVRGDIGVPPFSKSGKPLVHWINFWDRADIIGGSLETPANRGLPSIRVDNVEVGSFFFPAPGAAHSAYFEHEGVIETIYRVVFDDAYSFEHPPQKPDNDPDFDAARVESGVGERSTTPFQALMILLPWLCAVYLALAALGLPSARAAVGYVVAAVVGALILGWLVSQIRGHLHGIALPQVDAAARGKRS
jgi:hypothetical protein